jgi:tetratricopeptide (TPR) repeat protein
MVMFRQLRRGRISAGRYMGIVSRRFYLAVVVFGIISISLAQVSSQPEHDAYIDAMHYKDAQARAKALELFLKHYPSGRLREAALESLLQAYRQTGAIASDALDELLRINPNNLYGLTVKASLRCGDEPSPGMCAEEESELVNRGLAVLANTTKPEYVTESEFAIRKAEAVSVFHSLAGVEALRRGDYIGAQQHLGIAVQVDPARFASVYPLALAYLKADQPDTVRGLFFLARAASLAPNWHRRKADCAVCENGIREISRFRTGMDRVGEHRKNISSTLIRLHHYTRALRGSECHCCKQAICSKAIPLIILGAAVLCNGEFIRQLAAARCPTYFA